jgi:hypothetical protein
MRTEGTFEVKLKPVTGDEQLSGAGIGMMTIDKQFAGGLKGSSAGRMLTAMTAVKGSAGYVAIERVTGSLEGRRGTFVLQHSGAMARGTQELRISVVPDSGTGELEGLSGSMRIIIDAGHHSYEFEYTLAK